VTSQVGKGSTFTVSLPIAGPTHLETRPSASRDLSLSVLAEGYVEEALRWFPGEIDIPAADLLPTEEPNSAILRARILVADDNSDMREYLSRVLSKEYSVETFVNGASALAALSANPPDLVLADVMMPEINGFELLKTIREHPQTKHIPVILVSARAGQEARIDGMQAGADDYVTKPFSGRELLSRVRAQLNLADLRNESSKREHALRGAAEAERNKLHNLFQLAPAAIVAMSGPELRVVLANELYVKLVGRNSPTELLGKTIREALPEVEGQGYFELLDSVYRTGVPFSAREAEVKLGADLGALARQFVDFSYQPTFDAEGKIDGILAHIVDVTERVNARKQIEESESRFRLIADAAPALIWMAGPDQRPNYFNRSWLDFVGHTLEEEICDGWLDDVFPEDKARFSEIYRASFGLREPFEAELRLRHKSGEYRWILNRAVPRFGPDDTFEGFIGVCIDVNRQKQAEESLRKSEKLAVAGRLAATISHEINNPLQAVTSLHHLMSGSAMSDELRSYLATAQEELARVTHIVTHGLKFHRQATNARDEKLSELLDSTVAVYQGRLKNSGIDLVHEFTEQQPVHCLGSAVRQVFANLIGNAIDASRKGGRIILRTRDSRLTGSGTSAVRVTVADTGHGMDANALTKLFEPFFTTKGPAGTGLGLWVSKGILDKHGAKIRVKSRQGTTGSGTVFSILFPVRSEIDLSK
jgi:PAS domain S-box-containing protein